MSDHGADKADREVIVRGDRLTRWAATLLAGIITAGLSLLLSDYFSFRDLVVVLHAGHEPNAYHTTKCDQVERQLAGRVSRLEADCSSRAEALAELRGAFNGHEKRTHTGGSP